MRQASRHIRQAVHAIFDMMLISLLWCYCQRMSSFFMTPDFPQRTPPTLPILVFCFWEKTYSRNLQVSRNQNQVQPMSTTCFALHAAPSPLTEAQRKHQTMDGLRGRSLETLLMQLSPGWSQLWHGSMPWLPAVASLTAPPPLTLPLLLVLWTRRDRRWDEARRGNITPVGSDDCHRVVSNMTTTTGSPSSSRIIGG